MESSGYLGPASGTGVAAREEHMSDDEVPDRLEGLAELLEQRKPWWIATGPLRSMPGAAGSDNEPKKASGRRPRHSARWTGPRRELTNPRLFVQWTAPTQIPEPAF